ncbi:PREDICTED: phytochrome A-associated F-box protein-like [Camelina sativa]|uniref:Phytochrome A-associated F-box protein-like n=1 Tax=Camelina sativa TaxID=90675 RepID=A0ABM0TQE4_CAMSA|nr:PREDICTED: phytochrome A-associated F-box protein-like [Camelina sativa]
MAESVFSLVPEDVVFKIFFKLQDDPRNWARLACVCTKFSSIVRNVCWKTQCYSAIPTVISDLLPPSAASSSSNAADPSLAPPPPPGGWASLYKLAVCCPGLFHAGILLENSDFGLERELGPDQSLDRKPTPTDLACDDGEVSKPVGSGIETTSFWSLYDDLYTDTLSAPPEDSTDVQEEEIETSEIRPGRDLPVRKRRKICRSLGSHLASGAWNLSREQGNKLLASRFRGDCLYICNWPGCIHVEEKRNYMLFRGVFKDFKRSRVWRTINDGNHRSKISGLKCAFCLCDETWDLHSSFCLRRVFGFHDDGEPVVRAYVCENGHVSGAWTALPLYT